MFKKFLYSIKKCLSFLNCFNCLDSNNTDITNTPNIINYQISYEMDDHLYYKYPNTTHNIQHYFDDIIYKKKPIDNDHNNIIFSDNDDEFYKYI